MATKAEKEWMDAICEFGCIVCYLHGRYRTPCVPHHLLSGGRRIGHKHTIGLCDPGHHQNAPKGSGKISRHPYKARFEKAYGTESYLLEKTRELIALKRGVMEIGIYILNSTERKTCIRERIMK